MSNQPQLPATLALKTKVEEDFVSPLTAVRGALEILRDFPDLSNKERLRFIGTALQECAHLEKSVQQLADTVYAAGLRNQSESFSDPISSDDHIYSKRVHILYDVDAIEIDFSDFEFSSSKLVNEFYDVIDGMIENTGRKWYLLVNYRNCSIWPEAWVAFAHRGKKVTTNQSLGTVRFTTPDISRSENTESAQDIPNPDPNVLDSREQALTKIEEMKSANKG